MWLCEITDKQVQTEIVYLFSSAFFYVVFHNLVHSCLHKPPNSKTFWEV